MIQKTNSLSFKGAYLLKSPNKKQKEEFENVVGKRKIIFDNFNGTKDVLYVTRPSADEQVNDYLRNGNIRFCYYPNLDTRSGFSDGRQKDALALLETDKENMMRAIPKPVVTMTPKEEFDGIVKSLNLTKQRMKKLPSGIRILVDENGNPAAKISPRGEYGTYFVMIYPKNSDDSHKFLAISQTSEVLCEYKTPDGIKQFKNNFNQAVAYRQQQIETRLQKAEEN